MKIELSDAQATKLHSALRECVEIARHYRTSIADEDSIVLIQNLQTVAELLHLENSRIANA